MQLLFEEIETLEFGQAQIKNRNVVNDSPQSARPCCDTQL